MYRLTVCKSICRASYIVVEILHKNRVETIDRADGARERLAREQAEMRAEVVRPEQKGEHAFPKSEMQKADGEEPRGAP